jgi:hypothetical protein
MSTISISRNTRDKLKQINGKRQTYDEIISDLIGYKVGCSLNSSRYRLLDPSSNKSLIQSE